MRRSLCALGDHIRDAILHARAANAAMDPAEISRESQADTIYQIDKISEDAIAFGLKKTGRRNGRSNWAWPRGSKGAGR